MKFIFKFGLLGISIKQLSLPLARTEAHEQSFFVNVVSLWNALPEAIVSALSLCILI